MDEKMKKITWLASYPKSGNTWLRAFITALKKGEVDINELQTDGIFSSRVVFETYSGLDSSLLYDREAKSLQGPIFNHLADRTKKSQLIVKVHDAYTLKPDGEPLIPTESTQRAVYLIRNPLDIAASLANHMSETIDVAIKMINNDKARFSTQIKQVNTRSQFEQYLMSWSGHVLSWTTNLPFPVLVIRYEDMLTDAFNTFNKTIEFMGINANEQEIRSAIAASSFEQLQKKEQESGFTERSKNTSFFRNGKAENWRTELDENQINSILNKHKLVMKQYGYFT